ncbi:hypothetical protein [Undibacterium pigrum]|uniref:Uncharacterized protein n=1 Tax=Undibacterium pigrum TaxID=401470 RepID=A0A318JGR1_9BURK|nr:hypothetical protein [Undibacterium pigrum]PXX46955.1 hypothetical protein DFR42_101531 [Undibacterium pigrum]
MIRVYVAPVVFIGCTILSVMTFFEGNFIWGTTLLWIAVHLSLAVLTGFFDSVFEVHFQISVACITVLGFTSWLFESPFFDISLKNAHAEAMNSFANLGNECRPITPKSQDIQLLGIRACSLQEYSNQMDAILGAQKALYYGPTMSALDTANSMISKHPKDFCAEAVKIAVETCSQGGFYLDNKYKQKLLALTTK